MQVGETLLRMVVEESLVPTLTNDNLENIKSDASELKRNYIGGVLSTPAVRNLAKQYSINLNDLHGTGKDGRVLKEDVLKYAVQQAIIKDPSATVSADIGEQCLGRVDSHPHVSAEFARHYDDTRIPLRYY